MEQAKIVLFDGICNFCCSSVNFIIRNDSKKIFRFAPLQSEFAKTIIKTEYKRQETGDSIVLFDGDKIHIKSSAALTIARHLKFPYPLLYGFIIVPPFIRNFVYDFIARNRYKWFGKKDTCMIPTDEIKERFLSEPIN